MGKDSKIEWCHHTFNAWLGCAKISEACKHCYAENWAERWGRPELWAGHRQRTSATNWRKPHQWNAAAEAAGERHRVFCSSLADVFELYGDCPGIGPKQLGDTLHDGVVMQWRVTMAEMRADLWQLIRDTPYLDWLLVTKRPENIADMVPEDWGSGGYHNVWLGMTAENQRRYNERIGHLLSVQAAAHFLSVEPMLGGIELGLERCGSCGGSGSTEFDAGGGGVDYCGNCDGDGHWIADPNSDGHSLPLGIQWVIAGGESGPKARPSAPDWFRSLRDQCAEYGIPFLFKQWGEYGPDLEGASTCCSCGRSKSDVVGRDGACLRCGETEWIMPDPSTINDMYRPGKKAAGRLLDGVEHSAFPTSV